MKTQAHPAHQLARMIRDEWVLLDVDLAAIYNIPLRELLDAVERNLICFPPDFMYRLSVEEAEGFDSIRNAQKLQPLNRQALAFTSGGIGMLGSVLRQRRVPLANVEIFRAIVKLRKSERFETPRGVH